MAWLLTTRGRPKEAQRLLDACIETGMTQPGVCFIDGEPEKYEGLRLPSNWTRVDSENIGVGPAMNRFLGAHPGAAFYGWLADDFLPVTKGWDVALSQAAGDRFIAFCDDGWERPEKQLLSHITSAFAISGDLVRAVGWFSPPLLRQAGIDSAWNSIGRKFGLFRYLKDVTVEHIHWKNGKRERDETDNDVRSERARWNEYLELHAKDTSRTVDRFLNEYRAGPAG